MTASALLTTLVDEIVTSLNSSPGNTWSDLTVGTGANDFVKAVPCLDPEMMFQANVPKGLYINPVVVDYDRAASQGRGRMANIVRRPVVAVSLSYKFQNQDTSGLDVSPWNIVKQLLNLREEIDLFLMGQSFSVPIFNMTTEPPLELPLKSRWLFAVTEFEFEGVGCV